MKPRHKKFMYIIVALIALGVAVGLVMYALKENVSLYFTPSQVFNKEAPQGRSFRVGGLVLVGSLKRQSDGLTVHFDVTDTANSVTVVYKGFLPDLFKEGKGVVVHGKLEEGNLFRADEVLAKHDENYMAKEATYAIEQAKEKAAANAAPESITPESNATEKK